MSCPTSHRSSSAFPIHLTFLLSISHPTPFPLTLNTKSRYKIGDAFFHIPLPQAQEMLGISGSKLESAIEELEDSLGAIKEEMTQLKVELYARFGKSIQLET